MRREEKLLAAGACLSFVLLCAAHVLWLPPYEGFDETAHYSYITFLADRHAIPDFRHTTMDLALERDRVGLPRPYASTPPFDANGGITYAEFFTARSDAERMAAVNRFWRESNQEAVYRAGDGNNWAGQHPPLYYLLMAAPYRIARRWAPGPRLLLLRFASVALASASLAFWLKTIGILRSQGARRLMLLGGVAVSFFPSLFYDLARLGNDALLTLLFAWTLYLLVSTIVHNQGRLRDYWGLALVNTCGILTKLFFVPVTIGTVVFSVWYSRRIAKADRQPLLLQVMLLGGVPLVLTAWWFAMSQRRYGMLLASYERYLDRGIVAPRGNGLPLGQFSLEMLRRVPGFITNFLWCGTWSWVRPPWGGLYLCFAPLLALVVWSGVRLPPCARGRRRSERSWWLG